MFNNSRPFAEVFIHISLYSGVIGIVSVFISPFLGGCILSFTWALVSYILKIDIPSAIQETKAGKAILGFFLIVTGVILAGVAPNYLNTTLSTTEGLVMWGILFCTQIGLSLFLVTPLKSLAYWFGYIACAIILHSVILRFPNEFVDLLSAKTMVLISIMLSSLFLGIWVFWDKLPLEGTEDTKRSQQAKSIIGVFSGLLTVMEFINIMYTLLTFR